MMTSTVCGAGTAEERSDGARAARGGLPPDAAPALDGRLRRRARAATARGAQSADVGAVFLDAAQAAADAAVREVLEVGWSRARARQIVGEVAAGAGVSAAAARTAVCSLALRDPHLHALPPALGADAVLRILATIAPVRGASLWQESDGRRVRRAGGASDADFRPAARAAATELLTAESCGRAESAPLLTVPVVHWERPAAALVLLPDARHRRRARKLAEEAAATLGVIVQRELLQARSAERERELTEAGERRLARVAFDIHDGPLQELAAVGLEVATLRTQLATLPDANPERRLGIDRMSSLLARLASVETELRDLSSTLEPSAIARRTLRESLEHQLALVETQHGLRTTLDAAGETSDATPSQRIALVRILQEAARNAAEHGAARSIRVSVRTDVRGIEVALADDGNGFEVETELARAARRGRLGLISMSERVRLLGGDFDIRSSVGGPTRIIVSLPWWRPLAAEAGLRVRTHR